MKTFLVVLLLLPFGVLAQDTITDKAGNSYNVKILNETSDKVTVRLESGQEVTYPKKTLAAFAYAPGSRPEKRNNTIVLATSDDPATAMRKLVAILSDQGYGVQTVDKDLGILTTTSKGFVHGTLALNINVRSDSTTFIVLRGTVDSPEISFVGGLTGTAFNIEYRGMKGSPLMNAWGEMNKVALAYPSATVSYTTN